MSVDLSFIICTFNGAKRLPDTLQHLAGQANLKRHEWEVLVIDNASTDNSTRVAKTYAADFPVNLRVIAESTPGKTNAIRAGLRAARGRYFTLVDDDNHLSAEWLDIAVRFMNMHPSAGLIGGKIEPTFEAEAEIPSDFEHRYQGYLALRDYGDQETPGILSIGAGMTGRTGVMSRLYFDMGSYLSDRVGGGLGCCEDLEKSITMKHLGWESWYVPGLRMKHWIPKTRLTEEYIDRLWIEAAIACAWLEVLRGFGPTDSAGMSKLIAVQRKLLIREKLMCYLPPCTTRLRRARFWRSYYSARINAYREILRRADEARRIFEFIHSAPIALRPPTETVSVLN